MVKKKDSGFNNKKIGYENIFELFFHHTQCNSNYTLKDYQM